MAHFTVDPTPDRIDHALTYATREWSRVPEYLREFDSWDDDEQLDFVVEWPM